MCYNVGIALLQLTKGYLLSLPARRLAVQPKIRTVLTHCTLSDANCRKKSIPMCLACTALQRSRPASRMRRRCKPALGRPYIMSGGTVRQIRMYTYCTSIRKDHSFTLMMPFKRNCCSLMYDFFAPHLFSMRKVCEILPILVVRGLCAVCAYGLRRRLFARLVQIRRRMVINWYDSY